MRFVRFSRGKKTVYGIAEDREVVELDGDVFGDYAATRRRWRIDRLEILPPCSPSKIMAIGLNYADHAAESKQPLPKSPVLFLKAPSSVIGSGEPIILTDHTSRIDHEAELAVIIKDRVKDVSPEEAPAHVLGYTCANDVSHRPFQYSDGQWCRAKSFDTFCPLGPHIVTDLNPSDLKIECRVNGELRQSSRTSNLVFDVPYLVSFLSRGMTLLPGDVILTGTPSGVGPLKAGDTVEVSIEQVGTLKNPVL